MPKEMTKVTIVTRKEKFDELRLKMKEIGVTGMTVTEVEGNGVQQGIRKIIGGVMKRYYISPKIRVEIVVCTVKPEDVIRVATKVLKTGNVGDGKIFTSPITHVVRIQTGEWDDKAL